jgi:hypothetical protein
VQDGRTDWRRFAVTLSVAAAIAGGLVSGVASGALAASFSVSGTPFKLSADRLVGSGFTQYGSRLPTEEVQEATGEKYVAAAMSGIDQATITNLCQSVAIGPIVLRIEAGKDATNPVKASDLLLGVSELSGDATFKNIEIGQDASTLDKDGQSEHGAAGAFGQQADTVRIDGLRQVAYSTSASTFKLSDMSLRLMAGDGKECF